MAVGLAEAVALAGDSLALITDAGTPAVSDPGGILVRRAVERHRPDPADPIGVVAAVGGLEHAALAGFVLGGAVAGEVFTFLRANDHFFLNISMASCKAMLDAAHGVPNSSMVTAMLTSVFFSSGT